MKIVTVKLVDGTEKIFRTQYFFIDEVLKGLEMSGKYIVICNFLIRKDQIMSVEVNEIHE